MKGLSVICDTWHMTCDTLECFFLNLHMFGIWGSSRICLTWTKWPNYEEGPYKTLKKHLNITKAFIYNTLTLLI